MVYKTQDNLVFGFCPSSGMLKNKKEHNISKTGSVSVFRCRMGPLKRADLNHWMMDKVEKPSNPEPSVYLIKQ
jgi:hypothetical protein